jgi:hypothetical protein
MQHKCVSGNFLILPKSFWWAYAVFVGTLKLVGIFGGSGNDNG